MYSSIIQQRYYIPKNIISKLNTDYMIQVINQMLKKGIFSYAEILTKKALEQMRSSEIFNWSFY